MTNKYKSEDIQIHRFVPDRLIQKLVSQLDISNENIRRFDDIDDCKNATCSLIPLALYPLEGLTSCVIGALLPRESHGFRLCIPENSLDNTQDFKLKMNAKVQVPTLLDGKQMQSFRSDLQLLVEPKIPLSNDIASLSNHPDFHCSGTIVNLQYREVIPPTSDGIYAIVCAKDNISVRKDLQSIHHKSLGQCSNVERMIMQKCKHYLACSAYCIVDQRGNYHAFVAIIDQENIYHKASISQSTSHLLAENLFHKLIQYSSNVSRI